MRKSATMFKAVSATTLAGIFIGDAGVRGRPGGKPSWGPPAQAALRRLTATGGR